MKFNIDDEYRNSHGVYIIRALDSDKCYIGSTVALRKRWQTHRSSLKSDIHFNIYLTRYIKKYGINSVVFELLELVENKDNLIETEQRYINKYDFKKLFNVSPTAGSNGGLPNTPEQKRKISLAVSGEKNGFYGKKHSKKNRDIISTANKGKVLSKEHRESLSRFNRNKIVSKSTREKLSESSSLHNHSKEIKEKISSNHGFSKSVKIWKDGEFIKEFPSLTKACEFTGNSRQHVVNSLKLNKGVFEIKEYRYEISNQNDLIETKGRQTKIYLYKDGKFFKEFDSIISACEFTKNARSHVSSKMKANNGVYKFREYEYRFSKL